MQQIGKTLTASQLIRQAALKTGQLEVKPGKIIYYVDPELQAIPDETCWLCGGETNGQGLPTKKAIKPTFTDHPYARGQGSSSLCSGCAFCLPMRELRNYSILASPAGLQHPSRASWREMLLNPPEPPFVCCLAVSGQKHLSFKAPVNLDRQRFTVMLEEQPVHVVPEKLEYLLETVEALYIYFSKAEITAGRYNQHRIKECGLRQWEELEGRLEYLRGRPLFELAMFVAQKREKPEPEEEAMPEVMPHGLPPASDGSRKGKDKEPAGQLTLDGL
jgi:CRISPR type IV-associated protein Csf1